jgi:hypothetical protein
MVDADLEVGLRSLRQSLRRIKALLAWQDLKQAEAKPGLPPAFRITDSIDADLKNEYSFFLFTAVEMRGLLSDSTALNVSEEKREHFKKQLLRIDNQLRSLDIPARFYPPTLEVQKMGLLDLFKRPKKAKTKRKRRSRKTQLRTKHSMANIKAADEQTTQPSNLLRLHTAITRYS